MKYTKSQLRQLEGPELYRVLGDVQNALKVIDDADWEISAANREEQALEESIRKQAKKIKSKWVKITVALTPPLSIVLLMVIVCIAGIIIIYQEGGVISFSNLSVTGPDGETIFLMKELQTWLSESFEVSMIPKLIFSLIKTLWFPVTAITVIVYCITTWIDRKRHTQERLSALHRRYAANFTAIDTRRHTANQKIQNTKKRGIYQVAEVILPRYFMDYRTLSDLLYTMEKYRCQRLEDGINRYYQDQHDKYMENLEEERVAAAWRAAAAQEEQARIAAQSARDADRVNRETRAAAQRAADAAERTARAEEERTRIARDLERDYWRNT